MGNICKRKCKTVRFAHVFVDVTSRARKIPKEDYLQEGTYQIIDQGKNDIAGYTDNDTGLFCEIPAIVFGDHTRILKYVEYPLFIGADGVKLLRSKLSDVDYRYLYYALCSIKIENTGYNRHFKWLKESEIPLPPLDEQKRIAKNLDLASEIVKGYKEQLAELDKLVQSVFYEMFGDPVTNEKGWEICRIEHFCNRIVGGGTPSKSIPEYYNGNIPWVTPKDMKYDTIVDSIDHITEDAINNSATKLIPHNSVLMVIRSGILKHTLPLAINAKNVTINQDMKAFIPHKSVEVYYLFYTLKMSAAYLLKSVRAVTADNIEFSVIKNLIVPNPPSILQTRFASIVTEIEAQKTQVQKALTEAENLFNSLMQEYFE